MAGTGIYEFREKDDPRYIDRRMQGILRKITDNFDKFTSIQKQKICNQNIQIII
jgi:hypothetical protein